MEERPVGVTKKNLPAILMALLVAVAGTVGYLYLKSQIFGGGKQSTQDEMKTLVALVGQLIVLPQGEDPTIATVVDPERLRGQPFFANARKGDKVLIYANGKKAILYNPQSNKIVEVAPVNIAPEPPVASSTASSTTSSATTSTKSKAAKNNKKR